jgi:hypothetical protein
MALSMSLWRPFAGQNDVQPTLHVPIVYENVQASVPCWEYRVVSVDAREEKLPAEAVLDELGAQGWMLVSVLEQSRAESGSLVHYYFVRQKSEA